MNGFTEKDWRIFRSKIPAWQEAYINRLNEEYLKILNADANPSEKFWLLEKRINSDKKDIGVVIEMRRSKFISNILALIRDEVISIDDLEEFSDELKEKINFMIEQ